MSVFLQRRLFQYETMNGLYPQSYFDSPQTHLFAKPHLRGFLFSQVGKEQVVMPRPAASGSELVIHFDEVHIITVNFGRQEARLFENGGAKPGTLILKGDEPAAKASINDPMQLLDMALRYGISYELVSRVASESALKVLEKLGAKALLDKVLALTTEQERHQRFEGFEFSFANGSKADGEPSQPEPTAEGQPVTGEAEESGAKKKTTK